MIRASCHTADDRFTFDFDATPWFVEADPQSILHLAHEGWSNVWLAESLERRPGYERLHQMIEYAATRLRDESLEDPTWASLECVVNETDAMTWLDENRPDAATLVRSRPTKPQAT